MLIFVHGRCHLDDLYARRAENAKDPGFAIIQIYPKFCTNLVLVVVDGLETRLEVAYQVFNVTQTYCQRQGLLLAFVLCYYANN